MFAQKLVISLSLLVTSLFLTPLSVFAQTATPSATTNYQLPTTIAPTSPLYTDLLIHNMFHTFSCLTIGQSMIGQPCLSYQISRNAQGILQGVPILSQTNLSGGLIGGIGSILEAMYINPPVNTGAYLATIGQELGIKEARAQVTGVGTGVLNPVIKLWQVSRNIAYVLIIIIFLVIGLMVMFRNKLNPQTVITAQTALPGLVIGLIMITFSYFFAALITDMAFVGTNIVGYYFSAAQGLPLPPQDLVQTIGDKSVLTLFSKFIGFADYGPIISHAIDIIFANVGETTRTFLRFTAGVMAFQQGNMLGHAVPVIGDLAGIAVGLLAAGVAAADVSRITGFILNWVVLAILIYSMLKLLLNLIKVYLNIIFMTITAPFQFLFASLPGRQSVATGWILNMLANILAFPAVVAVLYFVAYLLRYNRPPFFNIQEQAGIISTSTLPLLGGLDTALINYLLAFGALVALPAIPDVISRSIGRASAAGQLLGQELTGNIQGGRGYSNQWNQAFQAGSTVSKDWNTYRGVDPGYNPAQKPIVIFGRSLFGRNATGDAQAGSRWVAPKWIPGIGGKQPFTRKRPG